MRGIVNFTMELGARVFTFVARVTPNHPGGYMEPPDPGAVEYDSVLEDGVEIGWQVFEEIAPTLGLGTLDDVVRKVDDRAFEAEESAHWEGCAP